MKQIKHNQSVNIVPKRCLATKVSYHTNPKEKFEKKLMKYFNEEETESWNSWTTCDQEVLIFSCFKHKNYLN